MAYVLSLAGLILHIEPQIYFDCFRIFMHDKIGKGWGATLAG
jgi:hypothetical protein